MRVLVVNPEPLWVQRIEDRIRPTGDSVQTASSWDGAIDALDEEWPDVLIIEHRLLQ